MQMRIADILSHDEMIEIRKAIEALAFEDGARTAGWNAKLVKRNRQARLGPEADAVRSTLSAKILANPLFAMAVRPKALTPLIIGRYGPGETYGTHIDDALMQGMRTDVSFTLFLAEPDTYEGGELVIETHDGEEAIKLPAGHLFLYPSTSLHRVEAVRSGERVVAVGWARSFIREAEQRALLFDLDTARRSIFSAQGKTPEFDLVSKSVANLVRRWAED
jgi:PKHD-type hydroxylase